MPAVWIVDDDVITRDGMGAQLLGKAGITDLRLLTHEEALTLPSPAWASCNVAVVDAGDYHIKGDQFPGVKVVRRIREANPAAFVIVATDHFFDDAVRRRMREARADRLYYRALDFAADGALLAAVLAPPPTQSEIPPPRHPEDLDNLGLSPNSNLNNGIDWWEEHGGPKAFSSPSRNHVARLRHLFNGKAHLQPRNSDGTVPDRNQDDPSLPQISRFIHWATTIKDRM